MGKLGLIRNVLRKIFVSIQGEHDPGRIKSLSQNLADELREAHAKSQAEWNSIQKKAELRASEVPTFNYNGKIDCVIPACGFGINTVHRLLLSYGSINYLKSVPMAIFFKTDRL